MDLANNAMAVQHGGQHYKGMAIQPFEFGLANAYDPALFSVVKYVSRHRLKGGAEDLKKAAHIVDIRMAMISRYGKLRPALSVIDIARYCRENQLPDAETCILHDAHHWAVQDSWASDEVAADAIKTAIQHLAGLHYEGTDHD